jgi:hypothetical protein
MRFKGAVLSTVELDRATDSCWSAIAKPDAIESEASGVGRSELRLSIIDSVVRRIERLYNMSQDARRYINNYLP